MATPKAVYLRPVLGDAAGSGVADGSEEGDGRLSLHGVSPVCPVNRDTHPKGAKVRCSQVAASGRVAKR